MTIGADDITARFNYRSPNSEEVVRFHQWVRNDLMEFALSFDYKCPDCREKSVMLTKLEEAMFWANAAIARHMND